MAGNKVVLEFGGDSKGLDKTVKDVDSSTKKMGSSFDKLALVGAAAGAAAGAAIAAGIAMGLEQSKTAALLDAQLGASAETAGHWGKVAGEVYARGVVGSFEDAADALKSVWQNGLINEDATDKELSDITAKVSNVAAVLGEDVGKVSTAVSQMLRTGLAQSADEAFDVLVRGAQQGINKSEDLLDTFNEYGTQFRKLGLDGSQALGLLSQGLQAGARDADTVADALKEFSIRAIDGSKLSADGFKRLGLDAQKTAAMIAKGGDGAAAGLDTVLDRLRAIKDPVQQSQIAVELFGTKAEDLGASLYALDPSSAVDALGNVAGAADKAGKALEDSAGARLERFKRQAQEALVDTLGKAVPYIEKTFGWLQKNSDWVLPLAAGLGVVVGVITAIVVATKIWTAVQTALDVVLNANPIGLIVLGIAALVAGIIWVATKTTWFQDIWSATWGFLKGVGAWFAGPFVDFFVSAGQAIAAPFIWLYDNAIKPFGDGVAAVFGFASNIVMSFVNLAVFWLTGVLAPAALWLYESVFKPVFDAIATAGQWLWDNALGPVFTVIGEGAHAVGDAAMWLWDQAISPAFNAIAGGAKWLYGSVLQPVFGAVMSIVDKVGGVFKGVFTSVRDHIVGVFNTIVGAIKSAINAVIGVINGAFRNVNGFINGVNKVPGVDFPTLPMIPKLHRGGIVPGGLGAESLYVLQAGERVTPAGGGSSGGGGSTVTLRAGDDASEWVLAQIRKAIGARGGDPIRVLVSGRG